MAIGAGENARKQGASRFLIFDDFSGGMNTQSDRHGLPEKQLAWLENLQPIAANKLLGVPGAAPTLATLTGETVVRQFGQVNIGTNNYDIAFCASGAAYAITVIGNGNTLPATGGVVTKIAPAGTFSAAGGDVTTFAAQRILIADTMAGYSTWDGNVFAHQGTVSPNFSVISGGFGYTNGATATITGVRTTFTVTNGGLNYATGANVAISGGSGTGMTAIAQVFGGVVAAIVQTNPGTGYRAGDTLTVTITPVSTGSGAAATGSVANITGSGATASVQTVGGVVVGLTLTAAGSGYTAADTLIVTITGVGGVGFGAQANAHPWPFISPFASTLAVAFGRVWLGAGRVLIVTGIGSATYGAAYDDFQQADASVTTVLNDADLVNQITALRFLNNYLYIIGDNSVKSIGGITVTGLNTTNFQIVTLSSDQGTLYRNTVISFNRLVVFANTVGVYAVFGASVEKISAPMDGIFAGADFTAQEPQAALNDIANTHTYLLLLRYKDPLKSQRSVILGYSSQRWYLISQGDSITSITTSVLGGITETFASSGADITQILQDHTVIVPFKVSTSLSPHGDPIFAKRIIRAGIAQTSNQCSDLDLIIESEQGQQDVHLIHAFRPITWINNLGQTITWQNNLGQIIQWAAFGFTAPHSSESNITGRWIGATIDGTANGIAIHGIYLEHQPGAPFEIAGAGVCTPPPETPNFGPVPPFVPTPPPPPPPPPPVSPAQYLAGQSCELFRFPLTASGTPTPDVNITGTISTLTGPLGNLQSNTLAVDVDPVTGNQFVLQQNKQSGSNQWQFSIPVFAPNATGNIAPIHNIVGAATGFPLGFVEATQGGICLDASVNIYAGLAGSTVVGGGNNGKIIKFATGSDGNATGTVIVTEADFQCQALAFDKTNNLIWAGGNLASNNHAQARSYTTAGVLQTTITCSTMAQVGEVFIGPTGQIVLAGVLLADGTKTLVKVYPSGSSGTDPAATQTLTISGSQGPTVACAAMDAAGLLYIGPISPGPFAQNINVYAAGVTGVDPATTLVYTSPLFSMMADGTATNIQQLIVR